MIIGHPIPPPQTQRSRNDRQDEPRRAHEEHGLVCRPDRIEGQGVPAFGLRDPRSDE